MHSAIVIAAGCFFLSIHQYSRVNTWCLLHGKSNAICISIHFNAYGSGSEWTQPSGWSIFTSVGNTAADRLADCIAEAAKVNLPAMKMRGDFSDGDIDYEEGFYILNHTMCPAALTENGFMTNEKECRWLQSEEAVEALVRTHVEVIVHFLTIQKIALDVPIAIIRKKFVNLLAKQENNTDGT